MHDRRRIALLGAPLLLGALALAPALAAHAGSPHYARTVTSPGPIDPKAIPLGDGYVSTTPKVGYVDSCQTQFGGIGGAQVVGPWIDTKAKTWNSHAKIAVSGLVTWPAASWKVVLKGPKRIVTGNDLPIDHTTGVFPVGAADPAAAYDRNPNRISAQQFTWSLPANPALAPRPSCTSGGPVGVLDDGVIGRRSKVIWNGRLQTIYHDDATLEYPYTIGCFHGTPISAGP